MYRTTAPPPGDAAGVVVVHCSDPRYQPHFQQFLRERLRIPRYALVAVPGGGHFATLADYLPKFAWVASRWLKFLVDLTTPERIILIGHDDCRWYLDNRFLNDPAGLHDRQCRDLKKLKASIAERFEVPRVELYYATLSGSEAVFEPLEP